VTNDNIFVFIKSGITVVECSDLSLVLYIMQLIRYLEIILISFLSYTKKIHKTETQIMYNETRRKKYSLLTLSIRVFCYYPENIIV